MGWIGGLILNKERDSGGLVLLLSMLLHALNIAKTSGLQGQLLYIVSAFVILSIKTKSVFLFYIFFEARAIPMALIIFIYGYQPEKLQAALFFLIYTVSSGLPLLLFLVANSKYFISNSLIRIAIAIRFIVKTPIYLLHTWLPKAHVEAPVVGSMFLSGVLLKLGSYGL